MEYIYLPETNAHNETDMEAIIESIILEGGLQYICYHISYIDNYPFLQIMLHSVEKELVLPFISINGDVESNIENISHLLIKNIKNNLKTIHCDALDLNVESYKGIFRDTDNNIYGLVNISDLNIKYLNLTTKTKPWFVLPTEIINIHSVCNIPISEVVIQLFTYEITKLAVLYKPNLHDIYSSPDIVYTGSEYKTAELQAIFGPEKDNIYNMGIPYYPFFNSFKYAVLPGGWINSYDNIVDLTDATSLTGKIIDNKYGRYVKGGVTRYALFMKNVVHMVHDICDIHELVKYVSSDCIIIQSDFNRYNPNILVKSFEQFIPLSYHLLNKDTLGEQYDNNMHDNYEIV
jgi:hypothetical protein